MEWEHGLISVHHSAVAKQRYNMTRYELTNLILAKDFSKSRKVQRLISLTSKNEPRPTVYQEVLDEILDGETVEAVLDRMESEEAQHWTQYFSNKVAADLLTLGKVQPETMLAISLLPEVDFSEIVRVAAKRANKINVMTLNVEQDIEVNSVPSDLV